MYAKKHLVIVGFLAGIFSASIARADEATPIDPSQLTETNHCTAKKMGQLAGKVLSNWSMWNSTFETDMAIDDARHSLDAVTAYSVHSPGSSAAVISTSDCELAKDISLKLNSAKAQGKWISVQLFNGEPQVDVVDAPAGNSAASRQATESKRRFNAAKVASCNYTDENAIGKRVVEIPGCSADAKLFIAEVHCKDELGGDIVTRAACPMALKPYAIACFGAMITNPDGTPTQVVPPSPSDEKTNSGSAE
jgi:hypothetical protein